jgi:hypothetical protein
MGRDKCDDQLRYTICRGNPHADIKEVVTDMIRKMLYKSEREGGGYTVSPVKPEGHYQVRWRLIAEEGRAITNGEITVTVIDVQHRKDCEAWQDCDLPEELKTETIDEGIQ